MIGDNILLELNTLVPSSILNKKCNAISYHRMHKAIAAKIMRLTYVKSEEIVSDILIKALNNERFQHLTKAWILGYLRFRSELM